MNRISNIFRVLKITKIMLVGVVAVGTCYANCSPSGSNMAQDPDVLHVVYNGKTTYYLCRSSKCKGYEIYAPGATYKKMNAKNELVNMSATVVTCNDPSNKRNGGWRKGIQSIETCGEGVAPNTVSVDDIINKNTKKPVTSFPLAVSAISSYCRVPKRVPKTCGNAEVGTILYGVNCLETSRIPQAVICNKECIMDGANGAKWRYKVVRCNDDYEVDENNNKCVLKAGAAQTKDVTTSNVDGGVPVEDTVAVTNAAPVEDTVAVTNTAPDCNTKSGCVTSCVSGAKTVELKGACVAKECLNGYYKVKKKGVYQGWCIYISCPSDQEPNIDAQGMWDQKTAKCRAKQSAETGSVQETTEQPAETGNNPTPEPCADTDQGIQSGHIVNGICVPESCVTPGWTLINGKCVHADGTDCKDIMYMADTATYQNGVCTVHKCYAGFEVKENQCVEISGPCESLPDNATRGHREYDKDTDSVKCIVDDCVDGYVVADDKMSCREDYEALAEQAREREQSTGNKLLGAVGMGATGIGGSMLMSGLAESNADDDAERAMTAYLETFTCKYGNESVSGGTMNVEIPGGNELINMYSEYVALANDLKLRKAALGMKPGIESEPILDSATSGLYDDVGTGRGKGAYASLARALENPDGEDAKAWAAQREDAQKKTKTGAITAGVGAGASLIGNITSNAVDKNKDK